MEPLIYLEIRQFLNSIKNTLRSPKRLIPALLIAAGVFAGVMQNVLLLSGAGRVSLHGVDPVVRATQIPTDMIRAVVFLFLSFGSVVILFQAFANGSLVFSVAHIDFLFPTPIPRRAVLLVKLIRDYLRYALWVIFVVTFTGIPILTAVSMRLYPYGFLTVAALTAYILTVINVAHTVNILFTFGFERLKQAGLALKVIAGVAVGLAVVIGLRHYITTGDCVFSVLWAANSPVIKTIFAPANWCAGLVITPLLQSVTRTELLELALLWALAGATFLLLMSRKENIYEPSLGVTVRAAKMRQALRSGDATALRVQMMQEKGKKHGGMGIRPFGLGATALFWKNLVVRYRMSWSQLLLAIVLPVLTMFIVQRTVEIQEILANLPFVLVYLSFIMSITIQPQMRAELKYANTLKSMPIAAWKVMFVQVLNGTMYLTLGISMFAAAMWVFIPATRTDLLKMCAIGCPTLGFACVSAVIVPALMYPDTRDAAQNFFCNLFGFMLISFVAIPTIVLGVVLFGLVRMPYFLALIPMCAANIILGAAGVALSGAIFRRFDPTSE